MNTLFSSICLKKLQYKACIAVPTIRECMKLSMELRVVNGSAESEHGTSRFGSLQNIFMGQPFGKLIDRMQKTDLAKQISGIISKLHYLRVMPNSYSLTRLVRMDLHQATLDYQTDQLRANYHSRSLARNYPGRNRPGPDLPASRLSLWESSGW